MGWFNKKESKSEMDAPALPELPKIPDMPKFSKSLVMDQMTIPHLPSYPNSSFGKKFSQNAIKDAVSGEKEDEEDSHADESYGNEMMPEPPQLGFLKRTTMPDEDYTPKTSSSFGKQQRAEPVFIRIDKFQESLKMFEETKKKISEMEEMFRSVKKIKEEEGRELSQWEMEIQKIKGEFEKINRNLFSKV